MVTGRIALALAALLFAAGAAPHPAAIPQRIVWVGAHPDDEIFAAPLLHELCARPGTSCDWLVLTRGERGACRNEPCGDLAARRTADLRRSAKALHAALEQWTLADGSALDPLDVLRGWSGPDCNALLQRTRARLAGATLVLTFDPGHGTSLHSDHRAAAMLVATALAGMERPPRLYAIENRAGVTAGGTRIEFVPSPAATPGALASHAESWPAAVRAARSHRSQFDNDAVRALEATPAAARVIVAAPRPPRTYGWCATPVDRRIDAMSDRERIAQLLFLGFSGQVADAELRQMAGEWHAGGIALYAHNIESRAQVRRLNEAIVRLSAEHAVPFIAIDQEGGIVHRLQLGVPVIPSSMALGAARSPDLARRAGFAVGNALRDLGFTMNFAPVLDILSDHRNAAIGTRAFSDDPELTALLGAAFAAGEQAAGVIAVGKHFPGQGGVAADTHATLPRLDATSAALQQRELVPFRAAFAAGLGAVMSAHIALPRIAEDSAVPATLSRRVMTGLLRDELHFDGIAITDALQMDALARSRGAGPLALDALLAGSDMVLTLGDAKQRAEVLDYLLAADRDGRLPPARVRSSLRRILEAKERLRAKPPYAAEDGAALVAAIAGQAVTLAAGSAPLVPLPPALRERIVYVGPAGPLAAIASPGTTLANATLFVAAAPNEAEFARVRALHEAHPRLPFVFVNLGSPFRIIRGPAAATLLLYAEDEASQAAALAALRGDAPVTGRAPIALP